VTVQERIHQKSFRSPGQHAVLGVMVAAGVLAERVERSCALHGLTHAQYNVLRILRGAHPDGHPRYEIARRLIDRAPDVTRLLDRLEAQGLVARERSEEDRRICLARITPRGMELLAAADPAVGKLEDEVMEVLGSRGAGELAALCDRVVAGLGAEPAGAGAREEAAARGDKGGERS